MGRDPRIDEQIAKAPDWAAAILVHLRRLVHEGAPDAVEDIKWSRPFFLIGGRPFAMMADFKAHCVFGFWRTGKPEKDTEGGGQYGKLRSLADLPDETQLLAEIRAAAEAAPVKTPAARRKPAPWPAPEIPVDLAEAFAGAPAAHAGFQALSPSCQREYLVWIIAAKRPETRSGRIATTIAQCAEGRKLNWKYEKC